MQEAGELCSFFIWQHVWKFFRKSKK